MRELGDLELERLWERLATQTLDSSELRYWGIAHGWAGVLYATARWCEATAQDLPAAAQERLSDLAWRARHDGEKTWWEGPHDPGLPGSWCHGTAGYTLL